VSASAQRNVTCRVFEVEGGWCAAARTPAGICAFVLPLSDAETVEAKILSVREGAVLSKRGLGSLVAAVRRYFDGWRTEFSGFKLDLSRGTEFQQRVWSIVRRIPYGHVRTYHWIGMEMGRPDASRAIGGAMGANPVPLIVPCHRVLHSDGTLGGFSAEGGVETKAAMLQIERLRIFGRGEKRRVAIPRK